MKTTGMSAPRSNRGKTLFKLRFLIFAEIFDNIFASEFDLGVGRGGRLCECRSSTEFVLFLGRKEHLNSTWSLSFRTYRPII